MRLRPSDLTPDEVEILALIALAILIWIMILS